jgi:hypothetical protein
MINLESYFLRPESNPRKCISEELQDPSSCGQGDRTEIGNPDVGADSGRSSLRANAGRCAISHIEESQRAGLIVPPVVLRFW